VTATPAECVQFLLRQAASELETCSPSPRTDAELLFQHALGWSRTALFTRADTVLNHHQQSAVQALLHRRLQGEPVAYITGTRGFWTLDLAVDRRVLIPRPETELLVERALALTGQAAELTVLDLGTGSGAVALALASERPHWSITASDMSDDALAVARHNATRLCLAVEWLRGSWFAPLAQRRFHLITSNPPYIPGRDVHLSQGDLRFEPVTALAAGDDGLDDLRAIIHQAPEHLHHGGWLVVEHGYDQGRAVADLFRARGFATVRGHKDMGDQDRLTEGCFIGIAG